MEPEPEVIIYRSIKSLQVRIDFAGNGARRFSPKTGMIRKPELFTRRIGFNVTWLRVRSVTFRRIR